MTAHITKAIQEKHCICKPEIIKEGKQFHSTVWEMLQSNCISEMNVSSLWQEMKNLNHYIHRISDQNNN